MWMIIAVFDAGFEMIVAVGFGSQLEADEHVVKMVKMEAYQQWLYPFGNRPVVRHDVRKWREDTIT